MARRWLAIVVLLAIARDARAENTPYTPLKPADPPLPRGSAPDPPESLDAASPTRPREPLPAPREPTGAALASETKRPRPQYGTSDRTEPSAAWWIPRVLLAPLYLVTEYVLRAPLAALMNHVERNKWPQKFLDAASFGTWGTDHQILLLPTAYFEWGVRANAGLALAWQNALVHGNELHASATAGGPGWLQASFDDRLALTRRSALVVAGEAGRRGDLEFYGLGPSSSSAGGYFGYSHAFGALGYEDRFWRSSVFESTVGTRSATFDDDTSERPTVAERIALGRVTRPPGFDGYLVGYERMLLALDTRRARHHDTAETISDFVSPPGTGARIEAHAEHATELDRRRSWLAYGGAVGAYLDLTGQQRTLGVGLTTELVDPIGETSGRAIPFTELASLGGPEPFRAFYTYRFVDRSYVAAKATYRWPVWASLDGALDATFGNVFGPGYAGFEPRLLRGSFTIGLETTAARDQALQLLLGFGTRTFADGFGVESVRVIAGTSRHF